MEYVTGMGRERHEAEGVRYKMYSNLTLLEYLMQELDCMFLSDLHSRRFLEAVQRTVARMDWTRFNRKEWNDAVDYITGTRNQFQTIEEAVHFLLTYTL